MPDVAIGSAPGKPSLPQRASLLPADASRPLIETRRLIVRALEPKSRLHLRAREQDISPSATIAGLPLGAPITSHRRHGDREILRLGPNEWLVAGPDGALAPMQREISEALGSIFHVVVDVSHRHAAFKIEGEDAAKALNAGCPLDLDPSRFPPGMATRTLFGKAEVILARDESGGPFVLMCWRSYARYVAAFLAEAATALD